MKKKNIFLGVTSIILILALLFFFKGYQRVVDTSTLTPEEYSIKHGK
jgi:hypothetical protein